MSASAVATLGIASAVVDCEDFSVAEVTHPRNTEYTAHIHDRAYVLLTLQGGFVEQGETVANGSVVLMPAAVRHCERIGPGGHRGMLLTFESGAKAPLEPRVIHGGPVSRILLRLYRAFRLGGGFEVGTMRELLLQLCDNERVVRRPERACVRKAFDIIEHSFASPLRFTDVARDVGVDAAYLSRAYRTFRGETMGETIRRLRARRAAELLSSTGRSIAGIALASGFADQSHLCRVFRHETGMTPLEYRRLLGREVKTVQDAP